MKIFKIMSSMALAAIAMTALNANATNIDANTARTLAGQFIQQQNAKGTFKAHVALTDMKLTHAEPSKAAVGANAYYAFNLKGGGFIIIAGEDRAPQVLGYSDKGHLNFDHLPYGLQGLLSCYKEEIEFLQSYKGDDLIYAPQSFSASSSVEPLIKTNWGQEDPYDWQCPKKNGEYCVVGCIATAMAQVMKYWQYPEGSSALPRFYSSGYGYVDALPATTFDYSLMINSYCHWDWDNSVLVQDTYTDAQAQEVAKLGRYCGQAVGMQYSPDGSGAYSWDQRDAMIDFGYRSSAQHLEKNGGWTSNYSTTQWESMMKTELEAGRPILYSASDTNGGGGHAFICDGYNGADGKFHFNFGWYGTCDGWYVSTALNMTHRDGDYLQFNSGQKMIIGIQPPEGWTPPVQTLIGDVNKDGSVSIADVTALIDYLLNGDDSLIDINAADVNGNDGITIADVTALIDMLLN